MDTPSLASAQAALATLDPTQLDPAAKIAYACAVAQIAQADASFIAAKHLHVVADATLESAGQARRLGDLAADLLEAIEKRGS